MTAARPAVSMIDDSRVLSDNDTHKLMEIVDKVKVRVKVREESLNVSEVLLVLAQFEFLQFAYNGFFESPSILQNFERERFKDLNDRIHIDSSRSNTDLSKAFEGDNILPNWSHASKQEWDVFYVRDNMRVCRDEITDYFKRGILRVNTKKHSEFPRRRHEKA